MSEAQSVPSLLGELGAYRVALRLMARAVRTSLSNLEPNARSLAVELLVSRLRDQQGELMYSAPPELPAEVQAQMNKAFQETFRDLIGETTAMLKQPNGPTAE
jgi:hypothetical protein